MAAASASVRPSLGSGADFTERWPTISKNFAKARAWPFAREAARCYRYSSKAGNEELLSRSSYNFFSNNRFWSAVGAQPEFNTDRFVGCRRVAPASSSALRDGEGVEATNERPASCDRESEWKRGFVIKWRDALRGVHID